MSKTLEQLNSELDAPIPRSAVSQRQGGGGRSLSYLAGHYVIDRLNKVFGPLNWASKTEMLKPVFEGQVNGTHTVHYIAQVRLVVKAPDGTATEHTCTGYGDGTDKTNPGKAHELAVKEAETDALKRAAKNLGQSMGLALYDKDQANVVEDEAPAGKQPAAANATAPASSTARTASHSEMGSTPGARPPAGDGNASQRPKAKDAHADRTSAAGAHANRDRLMREISALSKVAVSKGLTTTDELRADLKSAYGADTKEQLKDEQAAELAAKLKKLVG